MIVARVDRVTKRFGRRLALDDVTLSVESAGILGIVGPNGAGKTTLLRVMAGLIRPSTGGCRGPDGKAVRYFGGERTLPGNVSARAWFRLWNPDASAPTDRAPGRRFGVLSRGTRQRVALEAVLRAREAGLILLDEPWEGLDPDASTWLSAVLLERRAAGAAVVVSSHRIHDLAGVCDRCEFLVSGQLRGAAVSCAAGTGHELRVAQLMSGLRRAQGAGAAT
jgi:ABC-type multidrug transport system ATPase subunit